MTVATRYVQVGLEANNTFGTIATTIDRRMPMEVDFSPQQEWHETKLARGDFASNSRVTPTKFSVPFTLSAEFTPDNEAVFFHNLCHVIAKTTAGTGYKRTWQSTGVAATLKTFKPLSIEHYDGEYGWQAISAMLESWSCKGEQAGVVTSEFSGTAQKLDDNNSLTSNSLLVTQNLMDWQRYAFLDAAGAVPAAAVSDTVLNFEVGLQREITYYYGGGGNRHWIAARRGPLMPVFKIRTLSNANVLEYDTWQAGAGGTATAGTQKVAMLELRGDSLGGGEYTGLKFIVAGKWRSWKRGQDGQGVIVDHEMIPVVDPTLGYDWLMEIRNNVNSTGAGSYP
jgi:hypothetical protein